MFKFYPSAAHHDLYSGLAIWTKWSTNAPDRIDVLERSNNHVRLRCPDREMLLVSDSHFFNSVRPMDEEFHEVAHFSNFHRVNRGLGIDNLMVNYPQHLAKPERSPRHRRAESPRGDGAEVLADSGGFQILTHQIEFIDPREAAAWYNENTDIGVALDLPIPASGSELYNERLVRSAHIQAKNTAMMMESLDPRVRLMNVLHGRSLEEYQIFRKIVERPDLTRDLCISDVYHGTVLQTMYDVLGVILTGQKYEQYHLLGVYNIPMLLPTIWAAARLREAGRLKCISTDASTHIQSATVRMMHMQRSPEKPMERLIIGLMNPFAHSSAHRRLPCGCPVCSRVAYTDIYSILPGAVGTFLLLMHNQYEINRFIKLLDDLSRELTFDEYLVMAEKIMKQHPAGVRQTALNTLRMVHAAATSNEPMREMYKNFRYFMGGSNPMHSGGTMHLNPLHDPIETPAEEKDKIEAEKRAEREADTVPEIAVERFEALCERYEQFHAGAETVKHGSKKKHDGPAMTGTMFTKGHKAATGGKVAIRTGPKPSFSQVAEDEKARRRIKRMAGSTAG